MIQKDIQKVLEKGKLIGAKRECEYYPCHDLDEMDCTFCFCPFYPCEDTSTGGEIVTTENGDAVWGCKNCTWIHIPEIARKVLNEFLKLNINNIEEIDHKKLLEIRLKFVRLSVEDFSIKN